MLSSYKQAVDHFAQNVTIPKSDGMGRGTSLPAMRWWGGL